MGSRVSNINLDTGLYSGDIGLGKDYYLDTMYTDILLIKYIDTNEGGQKEEGGLIVPTETNELVWRKGEVLMVGPNVEHTKVGDLVVFPNDKGLVSSTVVYKDSEGNVKTAGSCIFLNEYRLFGTCKAIKED